MHGHLLWSLQETELLPVSVQPSSLLSAYTEQAVPKERGLLLLFFCWTLLLGNLSHRQWPRSSECLHSIPAYGVSCSLAPNASLVMLGSLPVIRFHRQCCKGHLPRTGVRVPVQTRLRGQFPQVELSHQSVRISWC